MNFLPSFRPKNPLLKVTQSLIDSNSKRIIPSTHPCLLSSFTLVHLMSRTHDYIGAWVLQTFTSSPGKLLILLSASTVSPPEAKLSQWFPGPFLVYLLLGLQSDISKFNPTICLPYLKSLAHFVFPGKRKKPTCPLSHDPQAIHDWILYEHSSFCVLFPSDIFHSWNPQPQTIFQLFQANYMLNFCLC